MATTARPAGKRTGRPPGSPPNREAILASARQQFIERGYDGATIRGIAAGAGVDPALVHHYFGTKDRLLVAAVQESRLVGEAIRHVLAGGSEGLSERIIRATVEAYETLPIVGALIGLFRSALTNEDAARLMGELFPRGGLAQLIEALDLPQPELRAALIGSEIIGLAVARFLLRLEPIASADVDSLVAWYAPTLQRYLTQPLPGDDVLTPER